MIVLQIFPQRITVNVTSFPIARKKKTGGKKSKSNSTLALSASSIETQPIPASKKDTNNMDALYKKMVKKSTKILDEKKKCYPENNLPIS
ncbi:hypothetical protein RIR_jg32194.t1 [Rhizophagus irregularis DAOM 181602=DAOM 197198]|nr:hypothetical protein RIR_jg32194.t1 [Rhizophagus irregularis DAOM 181602=DAOM 197198]